MLQSKKTKTKRYNKEITMASKKKSTHEYLKSLTHVQCSV